MKSLVAFAVFLLVGCGSSGGSATEPPPSSGNPPPTPPAATAQVTMQSSDDGYGDVSHAFAPSQVTIARGGSVTWNNNTGIPHNVTFGAVAGAPSDITTPAAGSNARTFPTAGTFAYQCTFHAGMTGTVQVAN